MKINFLPEKEILDFEKEIGYEMTVNEREVNRNELARFYVCFENGESMEGGCLVSYHGNGNTIDEALKDYCKKISCRKMVFGAYTDGRREIQFPKLVHTKLINQ